jgi:hypothetical protein
MHGVCLLAAVRAMVRGDSAATTPREAAWLRFIEMEETAGTAP